MATDMNKVMSDITAILNNHKLHPLEIHQAGIYLVYQGMRGYVDDKIKREIAFLKKEKLSPEQLRDLFDEIVESDLADEANPDTSNKEEHNNN